ncbi:hypothetical protein [Sporosarcina beigongshangi]|uniref:hypothetical protein n=1 Tax=Sporosarcina beigongshangi TaxID=2782538 RepID=UPI00193A2C65|nr:hypothetical protein [Sporosarcina beigongshangi]
MSIKLTLKKAAESKGVSTQAELLKLIKSKTGVEMRPNTLSAMYRDTGTTINKEHLAIVMKALDITDFSEILTSEG